VDSPQASNGPLRFADFELDLRSAELRKAGVRLRLQDQPFQVLAALLERPGEVVTREELVQRLWGDGTVVDYERGLNAAVTRLRQALSDSAETPRYIETVARRGYRFIGTVEKSGDELPAAPPPAPSPPQKRDGPPIGAAALIVVLAALAIGAFWWRSQKSSPPAAERARKVVPLTSSAGVERNASFSPDGSQVVYEWLHDGKRHLYVKVVGSGDPVPLTSRESAEYGPAWSPDGRLIAFLRQLNESAMGVFVIPPVGGVERKVAETAPLPYWVLSRFHRRLDWTRDSAHLVVSVPERADGIEKLSLISVDSGAMVWLTNPTGGPIDGDREPVVSPDGRTLAFTRGQVGAKEVIYLQRLGSDLRPSGAPSPLTAPRQGRSPAWTPDGKRMVYTTISPGSLFGAGVAVMGLNSGDPPRELLALGRHAAMPTVSRTGRIAYSQIQSEGQILRQETATPRGTIASGVPLISSSSVEFNAQYSPDGSHIAFASNRSGFREIWTCLSDGTHCLQLTALNGSFIAGTPRWSPDGKQIAFDSSAAGDNDVYVVSANGGSTRRVTDDRTHGFVPSWSHDGGSIYFCSNVTGRNEIWKIPSAGGKAIQVTHDGGFVVFESPDGQALYYTKTEQNAALFRSTLEGTQENEVVRGVAYRGFAVAADRIYYLRREADGSTGIWRFLLGTRENSKIGSLGQEAYLGLALSPDGKYLLYSAIRLTSNIMLVEDFQ
jgi:Tol biopolymer transport system component/DNA-binding winged helix-turn-helix (wHTH) protein